MKKVFVIVCGEYSDWDIKGYFTEDKLEDAIKWCNRENTFIDDKGVPYTTGYYYIMAINEMSFNGEEQKTNPLTYIYEFELIKQNTCNDYIIENFRPIIEETKETRMTKSTVNIMGKTAYVNIVKYEPISYQKLTKIVYDKLYQKLYEIEVEGTNEEEQNEVK